MAVPYAAFPKYGPSVLGQAKYDAELASWQAYVDSMKQNRPEGEQDLPEDHHENLDTYTYLHKYVKAGQSRKRIFREQNIKARDVEGAIQQGRDAMNAELGDKGYDFDGGEANWKAVPGTEKAVKPRGKAFEEGEDERRNDEGHNGSDSEADAESEGQDDADAEGEEESDDDAEGEGEGDDEDSEADADSEGDDDDDGESEDEDDTPKMPTCPECGEQRGTTEGCCKVEPPENMPMPDPAKPEEPNLQLLRTDGEAPYVEHEAHNKVVRISHTETVGTLTKSLADVDLWTRKLVAHDVHQASSELYEALTLSHKALKDRIAKGGGGGGVTKADVDRLRDFCKLEIAKAPKQEIDLDDIVAKVLEKANLPQRIEVSMNGQVREIDGTPHKVYEEALECLGMDMPLLLVGPAGSGKGFLAQHLADGMGVRFGFSSCSEGMSEGMLLGRGVPLAERFLYLQSSFVDFYENGGLFLLDEIDAANPNVILILNECLSSPHLSIPNRMDKPYAKKHEDFYFACNANTWGTGPNMEYVGRNRLDSAFLDRFIGSTIELDYDNRVEGEIAKSYLGAEEAKPVLKRYWSIRKKLTEMNIRRIWSTRGLEKMCRALAAGKEMGVVLDRHTRGWTQDEKNKAGV